MSDIGPDERRILGDRLADALEKFMREMDALENPRPAGSWFAMADALRAYRKEGKP